MCSAQQGAMGGISSGVAALLNTTRKSGPSLPVDS